MNFCDKSDLLTIPGVGDRTADKIVAIREKELFSLQTFADLIKKDPDEIGELVSFDDLPSSLPGLTHMSRSIALCDQRNALYSRDDRTIPVEETIPRRRVDERQDAGRNSPVLTHLPLDRDSRSGPSIQEPYEGRKYVNPPKTFTYAGDADWASFKLRYEKFCRDQKYMDLASLDYLCWVLTGKAAEYHALVIRRYPGITYREMMDQLEKRFGFRQLPQTAYLQFHQSRQKQDEKLEEWAERVCQLASYAFETAPRGGLSDRDAEAMIRQFCIGTLDKEAGFHAANAYPTSLDDAITHILKFQFHKRAVYGSPERRERDVTARAVQPHHRFESSRRDYSRRDYSPGRYESRRRYESPGSDRNENRRGFSPDASGYRRRFESPGMDRDEYRRRYSPIPYTRDEYRRNQTPTRDRRSFQSPNSADRNGRSKSFEEEVMHLLRKMDTRLDDLTTRMERLEAGRRSPSPRRNATDFRCHGCGKHGHFVSQCPEDTKRVHFEEPKNDHGSEH